MAEALLHIEDLSKRFGGVTASENVSLAVPAGELHAIIGPNGAGKTTLIGQLTGEVTPDVILAHPGWGETLFLKDIFPGVPLLSYCEFYYHGRGADIGFTPDQPSSRPCRTWRQSCALSSRNSGLRADTLWASMRGESRL